MDPQVRATNEQITRMYDLVPWRESSVPWLNLDWLLGVSRLYGVGQDVHDVLDLGCGGDTDLLQIASQVNGRLVGVDISPKSCAIARESLAPFAQRTTIHCADLLTLDAALLGKFDLIYLMGVLYVTPTEIQQRLLTIFDQCLRPGGLVVISYYVGPTSLVRAGLYHTLRAVTGGIRNPSAAIAAARHTLKNLRTGLAESGDQASLTLKVIDEVMAVSDATLFHEVFNPSFRAIQTTHLEQLLAPAGLQFLSYLWPTTASFAQRSATRALTADRDDFAEGGYRHALFGRRSAIQGPDPRAPGVRWASTIARTGAPVGVDGAVMYQSALDGTTVNISRPFTQAVLDELAGETLTWVEAEARATEKGGAVADDPELKTLVAKDACDLWLLGMIRPLAF